MSNKQPIEEFSDTQAVRAILSGLAMQGLLASNNNPSTDAGRVYLDRKWIAEKSIDYADALIAELARTHE